MDGSQTKPFGQGGRRLGPRALQTRERLLRATGELLAERSMRDVSVVEIARKANTSPATFYQYFQDVQQATLHLAEAAAEELPPVLELIDESWEGPDGLDRARAVVRAFVDHWDAHRSALLVRNLFADEGDQRFVKVRRRAMAPVIEHLARKVRRNQERGRIGAELHPAATAVAMASILERLAAYHREIEHLGASREELIESSALILYQTVAGRDPAGSQPPGG